MEHFVPGSRVIAVCEFIESLGGNVDEALKLGIAMELVPVDGLMARADELARSFTGASALAVSLVKHEVGMSLATDLRTLLASEADHQALCFETDSHRDAVRRFLAKEPAAFQYPAAPR